ncbi:MAG: hypothetical protein KF824_07425 [Fimbriimonadaceae bacterium]|nr:MAG: hypothetical protein KF824_07425 [Fimbriimonadaceae bacterium]
MPVLPIRVEISNDGKPELVELISKFGDTQVSAFMEMPTGATKQREFYIASPNYWSSPTLIIKRGLLETEIPIELRNGSSYSRPESIRVAQISDGLGNLAMLRVTDTKQFQNKPWSSGFEDFSAKPGLAPTRSIGYQNFDLLFLGEGSERLTDTEVNAIKGAVLSGMHLVFIGGAFNPVIADPRWQGIVPIIRTEGVQQGRALEWGKTLSNVAFPNLTLLKTEASGSAYVKREGGVNMLVSQQMGAGRVSFIAFNPFDADFRNWGGRFAFMYDLARNLAVDSEPERTSEIIDSVMNPYYYGYSESSGIFGIQMPSWNRVAFVLFAYLMIVVPINFLVLRKLKRGELAWITAPVIALGFAGILFGFAGQLYQAEASRSARGVVIAHPHVAELQVIAAQQLFFPGSGVYDLKFNGVEHVGSNNSGEEGPFGMAKVSNQFQDFDGISATRYSVSNLAFREFWLYQRLPINDPDMIVYSTRKAGDDLILEGSVINSMPFELSSVILTGPGISKMFNKLAPGESAKFQVRTNGPLKIGSGLKIEASCSPQSFGAQFGSDVSSGGLDFYYDEPLEGL